MNEAYMNLLERRSIRKYDDRPVPDELLDAVLQAGIHAPSGMNTQGVRLVAVRDPQTVVCLSKLNAAVMNATNDPFYGAPCVVIVLADPEIYGGWVRTALWLWAIWQMPPMRWVWEAAGSTGPSRSLTPPRARRC